MLGQEDDLEIVWSVSSMSEALSLSEETVPGLIVIDFTAPTLQLLSQVNRFRTQCPRTQIVAMTDHGTDICVLFQEQPPTLGFGQPKTCCLQQAFMVGARGAVRKTADPDELIRVIHTVHGGQITVEEPSLSLLLSRLFGQTQTESPQPHLTDRERDVVRALALGKSNKEIAVMLGIREQTVKNHISHILEKLGLEDRLQIVVFAARNRLVSLDNL
jgi:DNA-binding NarL/FixJ family response regulator